MNYRTLANQYFDSFKKDLKTLVSIPSVRDKEHANTNAPFGPAVQDALETMLAMGKRDGFATKNFDGYAGTITIHDAGPDAESVGILGHLDVVPAGDGWTRPAYDLTQEKGWLFGRGVLDDKGPLLAAYYAMKILHDQNVKLNKTVYLIAGTDEESGMEGIDYYLKNGGTIPAMGFTPDADFPVIYGEKGNIHMILESDAPTIISSMTAGERPNIVIQNASAVLNTKEFDPALFDFYLRTNDLKGSYSIEDDGVHISMIGKPAHGSTPYLGNNAGVHLFNYVGQAYNDALSNAMYALLKDWKGTPEHIDIDGLYMGFLTMNPGQIEIKDGHASVLIDIRYPNDTTPEKVLAGFEEAAKESPVDMHAKMVSAGKPLFVDPNSRLVKDLMQSYADYTGDTFSPAITIGGGTYAKHFDNFVAFGPEKPWEKAPADLHVGSIHSADEGVSEDALEEAIAIYADAIERLAS